MQNQMHLKKAIVTPKSRELSLKNKAVLAPVMDFNKKNKKEDESFSKVSSLRLFRLSRRISILK